MEGKGHPTLGLTAQEDVELWWRTVPREDFEACRDRASSHILFPSVIQVGMWHTRDLFLLVDLRASGCLRWQAGHEVELCTAGIAKTLAWNLKAGTWTRPKGSLCPCRQYSWSYSYYQQGTRELSVLRILEMPKSGIQKEEAGVPCAQHPDVPYRTQQGPSACFCLQEGPGHITTGGWAHQLPSTNSKPSYRSSKPSIFKHDVEKEYNHLHSTGEETSQIFSWRCLIFHLRTNVKIFFSPFGERKGQRIIDINSLLEKSFPKRIAS